MFLFTGRLVTFGPRFRSQSWTSTVLCCRSQSPEQTLHGTRLRPFPRALFPLEPAEVCYVSIDRHFFGDLSADGIQKSEEGFRVRYFVEYSGSARIKEELCGLSLALFVLLPASGLMRAPI